MLQPLAGAPASTATAPDMWADVARRNGTFAPAAAVASAVGGFGRSLEVAGGQPDHHGGREDAGAAGSRIRIVLGPCLLEDAADRRGGHVDAPLREPEECKTRLRIEPMAARLAVGILGAAQVAAQAQQLSMLVERHPRRGLRRVGQPVTGSLCLRERLGPRAVERLDLGAVDEALAAERHEIGLRRRTTGPARSSTRGPAAGRTPGSPR